MIFEDLNNLNKYVSENITNFIQNLSSDTPNGRYNLENGIYANIETYQTKDLSNCKFEAHKKFIDIQMLLDGQERLDFTSIEGLKISEKYDENRDIMFFENPDYPVNTINLKAGNFALILPSEAHKPQINHNNLSQKVKKVVVKIPV